ncbi:AEC family transporter [Paraglaciecola sp. 20A4]|uniref:AEC family transporter n=1 Tax=Paraglaciecola sp. 20A4 TaxID=2687288 RepID=UPI00140CFCC1|nr:AEC family transporter [Paraglaciecola sp. 20A4]
MPIQSLLFAIEVTLPISLLIVLGIVFKRIRWINEEFAIVGSRLVFNVTLPCLLFVNIAKTDLSVTAPSDLLIFAVVATTAIFLLFNLLALNIKQQEARGAFAQGACRGNMAIIGLALCVSAFGESAQALASMYLAAIVILYNVYSILTLYYHQSATASMKLVALSVLKNPLAIAIVLAIIVALVPIQLPELLYESGSYLAQMTLPLALLCVGASIRLQEFKASKLLYIAIASKIVFIPLVTTVIGYLCGFRNEELGVLYIMMATPTAAAAYPMVRAIGGDHHLTAAIIAGSTLFSMFSTTLGLFLLHYLGWV